jgi:2-phosphosulfolactate phosphatase
MQVLMTNGNYFDQAPHRVRFDWGWRGCRAAAARGDLVVIVDVLRFSTMLATASSRGIQIVPASDADDVEALQNQHRAIGIENSLAPARYLEIEPGTRVVVRSPNGATCVRLAREAPEVVIGAIVNASAVAAHLREALSRDSTELVEVKRQDVTVVACGERWMDASEDGALRFAIEDYLGAGAILHRIGVDLSAEAQLCARAFEASKDQLLQLLLESGSGRELLARGDRASIELAATLDRFDLVPVLRNGVLLPLTFGSHE